MSDFRKEWITLQQAAAICAVPEFCIPHVTFDPRVKPQYFVRRSGKNDGTLIYEYDLIERALLPLVNCETFYVPMGEPPDGMIPQYTVGRIRIATVYGVVDLPCGQCRGQRQSVSIPVSVRYAPRSEALMPNFDAIREFREIRTEAGRMHMQENAAWSSHRPPAGWQAEVASKLAAWGEKHFGDMRR